jgi:hypothetical protein
MIALNRLDDLAPPIRRWVETLSADERRALVANIRGSTEETTTGVIRLKAMQQEKVLQFPIVAVNDSNNQAHVRQPLRHRAVDPRWDRAGYQHARGREQRRGRGVWLVRAGLRHAGPAAPAPT